MFKKTSLVWAIHVVEITSSPSFIKHEEKTQPRTLRIGAFSVRCEMYSRQHLQTLEDTPGNTWQILLNNKDCR